MNILTAGVSKGGGITSNYPQVKQALQDYVAVRNQSVFDSVKEKMANNRGYKIIRVWQSEFNKNPNILLEKLNNVIFI